jgi:hypothetical protein
MDTIQENEQRLWAYIDGLSTAEEKSAIDKLIQENREWRALYHELLQVHQALTGAELEQPSLRFTKNVMEEIARHQIAPATKAYINHKIIWGIAAFFILSIVGFLVYGIGQIDWSVSRQTESPLGIDLTKIEYGKVFTSNVMNVFMMLNAVLGLMLLDRYISNKRKKLYDAV